MPSGGYINGFFAKNADGTYAPDFVDFDTYTAQSDDIWLLADVVDMPVYVMYSFTEDGAGFVDGTDTVLDLAPFGSVYTISLRTLPTGYHIVSLILQAGQQDTLYFDRADLDGFELELTEPFYIINADLTKNTYNVTYEINGEFYENRVMRHGDLLKFEDPTETLLKGAFPEGTEFSFTSYSLVTKDPLMGIDDLNATTEMNVQLGEEIAVTENITVNMIVYVKGQERAPEEETDPDDEAAQRLAIAKAEKRAEAQTAADALLQQVNGDPAFSEIKRSEFVTEIELALSAAFSEIDASTTVKETEEAIGRLTSAFERIREMMLREKNITVEVIVSGITAKGKTYDGTDKVELDLSHVVYLNAETLSEIDPAFSKDFVLDVKATLSDKNAGIRAVKLSVSLDGGTYYALAESGKEMTVMVEIGRAKLTVSVNEAGDPVYSGFAEGEDESVLSGELKIEYAEENGKRVMVPSGVSSDNYDITFVSCPAESSNLGLILGIVIPITVLAVAAVVIVFLVRKKRKS